MRMKLQPFILPLLLLLCTACGPDGGDARKMAEAEELYVQHIVFPENASLDEKVALAARLAPSQRQLAWQRSELTAFLHFGINTFTDREWGDGRENPELFNPSALDASQWVRTLKECGFEMVILTAKHHDGFCLWPTSTTTHSVASSPWRDGKGDVVAEVAHACADEGMKFGVYLSPWDRNAECYGDSERYNQYFVAQLTELLTNYGKISEVWFDGACGEGPNGKKQVYDWDAYLATIRRLQPEAVSAVMGEDVRWVGNEGGVGRETEWSATVITPGIYSRAEENNAFNGVFPKAEDLGSRAKLEKAKELFWFPSEVDVSIRPGWFWHERENAKVKSLERLVDIYFASAGRNSVLLLNIPPDANGLLNDADVVRLREFAAWRKATFSDNKVLKGNVLKAVNEGECVEYKFASPAEIDAVMVCEHIENGQRVESFTVEVLTSDGWQEAARGTTVGNKRLLRFEPVTAEGLRIRIDQCRAVVFIDNVGAYRTAPVDAQSDLRTLDPALQIVKDVNIVSVKPLVLDMGSVLPLSGFVYAPADGVATESTAVRYSVWVSVDGEEWQTVSAGEFGNIVNNPVPQIVELPSAVSVRYVRFEGTSAADTPTLISSSEVTLLSPR